MKFNVLRTDIAQAVMNVSRAVSAKATLPALEGILIKAYDNSLTLTGFDLDLGITTTIEASVTTPGEIVVGARLFSEIVRKLPEEIVTFETDERLIVYISSGSANYQIVGMSSAEFPEIPTFEAQNEIKLSAGIIKSMIKQSIFAVSENYAKPIYTGSLFEIKDKLIKIIAVDGFRLAVRQENIDCDSETSFIVPGKMQSELLKLLSDDEQTVTILVGQRHVIFNVESYSVISRLIEGSFLDYHSAMPQEKETVLRINTRSLINAVERMSLLTSEKLQSPVRIKIAGNEMSLTCRTAAGRANEVIPINPAGEPVEIGFNSRYLLDALRNTECDEAVLTINGGLKPMLITPVDGESFLFFVVPMRLNDEM